LPLKPLTPWRGKDRHHQQGPTAAHHRSHSLPKKPRTGAISRAKIQLTMEGTHSLERQGQALSTGSESSSPWTPLTVWRAQDRHCQQGPNPAYHGHRSQTGEPKTGVVNRVQIQHTTDATYCLVSQGQVSSTGSNCSSPWEVLTNWRAKDRCGEQGPNTTHHGNPLTCWRTKDRCHES